MTNTQQGFRLTRRFNNAQRHRHAASALVGLICLLIVVAFAGMLSTAKLVDWIATFAWSVPICTAIAFGAHLIVYLFYGFESANDDEEYHFSFARKFTEPQRRRLAVSTLAGLACMMVVMFFAGLRSTQSNVDWIATFAWSVPICTAIAFAVHLIEYMSNCFDADGIDPVEEILNDVA